MSLKDIRTELSHLPINDILDDIIQSIIRNKLTVVNAKTASGKTLLIPTQCAVDFRQQILVLEPRRFIAMNVTESICDIGKIDIGNEIGYAVGVRGREESCVDLARNEIVYMTYGYALASKHILKAKIVFIDEAHEQSLDMAICKALLKKRIDDGEDIRVVVMSATMDVDSEIDYWNVPDYQDFYTEGHTFPCERRHYPAMSVSEAIVSLIEDGKQGILAFVAGIDDIKEATDDLVAKFQYSPDYNIEIFQIHSNSPIEDRRIIMTHPTPGKIRVVIGTNVIESGVSFTWVDSGVSSGTCKEAYGNGLVMSELPQWRIDQQAGRTNRFRPSVYVLTGPTNYDQHPKQVVPEILRTPLTDLVMHCAYYGINPGDLTFHPQPEDYQISEAIQELVDYRFISVNENTEEISLTEYSEFGSKLPVGIKAKAMLCQAWKLGIIREALILVSVAECETLRHDFKIPHDLDRTSDILDRANAFAILFEAGRTHDPNFKSMCEHYNVNRKRWTDARDILRSLEAAFRLQADHAPYQNQYGVCYQNPELLTRLKSVILAGYIRNTYRPGGENVYDRHNFTRYKVTDSSICEGEYVSSPLLTGDLRTIHPKKPGSRSFTVVENITCFTHDDLEFFIKNNPDIAELKYYPHAHHYTFSLLGKDLCVLRHGAGQAPRHGAMPGSSLGDILSRVIERY